ncbi:MAG: hypothetical protein NVSMB13_07930 [Mycobacteriales bacterium]
MAAVALLTAACGGGGGSKSTADKGTATKEPVVYGVIDDLTGAAASIGTLDKKAAELAVNTINKNGGANGHPLKLVFYDNKSDPALTAQLVTRLVTQDKAAIIACCASSTAAAAGAQAASALKTPMLTQTILQTLTAANAPWHGYLFRTSSDNNSLAQYNVDFIASKGWKKVALEHSSLSFGTDAVPYFKESIGKIGGSIVSETQLTSTATDASVQAAQIIASKPDVLLTWDYPAPDAQLIKAIRSSGGTFPIVSNYSAINPVLNSIAGSDVPNLYSHDNAVPANKALQDFSKAWTAAYNEPAPETTQGIFGYVNAQAAAAAIKDAKTLDAEGVRQALINAKCISTVFGRDGSCLAFGPDNYEGTKKDPSSFIIMKQLQAGKWVQIS